MPPEETNPTKRREPGWRPLLRFLPYLWPAGHPALKARVVIALILVFVAKGATLVMPFAYKAAIDRMTPGMEPAFAASLFGLMRMPRCLTWGSSNT